jgi:hypothetical protein
VSATWSFPPEIGEDSPWPIFERVLDYPELASQAELARDHEVRWAFVLRREMGEDGMWLQGQRRILGMACMPRVQGVLGGLFGQLLEDALDYLPDFLIVLDRSWWEASTDREREILVFHELLHCGQALDGQGAPKFRRSDNRPVLEMIGHDVEEFTSVVRRYGAWKSDLRAFQAALEVGPQIPNGPQRAMVQVRDQAGNLHVLGEITSVRVSDPMPLVDAELPPAIRGDLDCDSPSQAESRADVF